MRISFDFNNKEYYEFVWFFERLVKAKSDEEISVNTDANKMSLANLGATNLGI